MKLGAGGRKQEVELVAQELANHDAARLPEEARRPRPGDGSSVAMELRCARAQAEQKKKVRGKCRPGLRLRGDMESAWPRQAVLCTYKQTQKRRVSESPNSRGGRLNIRQWNQNHSDPD
jgi:hypothetical protein